MEIVDKLLGTPYVDGGRKESGADCWGLCVLAYKYDLGVDLEKFQDVAYVSRDTAEPTKESVELIKAGWLGTLFKEVDTPRRGDLIIVRVAGMPIHIGYMLSSSEMLHSSKKSGVSVANINGIKWRNRIEGIYRYSGE